MTQKSRSLSQRFDTNNGVGWVSGGYQRRRKAGLCILPEEHYYSSAKFYLTGIDDFEMLTHADE